MRALYRRSVTRFQRLGARPCPISQETCKNAGMEALDKLDRSILRILQQDGRATYEQIAAAVRSTPGSVRVALFRIRDSLAACIERRLTGEATA